MKRSEMKEKIYNALYGLTMDSDWVEQILSTVEELGMLPPGYMKPIPFVNGKQYPLVPGDFKNDDGVWCTPGVQEWEPEYGFDSVQARNEREELRAKLRAMSDDEFDEYIEKQNEK